MHDPPLLCLDFLPYLRLSSSRYRPDYSIPLEAQLRQTNGRYKVLRGRSSGLNAMNRVSWHVHEASHARFMQDVPGVAHRASGENCRYCCGEISTTESPVTLLSIPFICKFSRMAYL